MTNKICENCKWWGWRDESYKDYGRCDIVEKGKKIMIGL